MFKLIKKVPYWYLIAIPVLVWVLGAASNQAVLIANGDKFPVLENSEKIFTECQPKQAAPANLLPFILNLAPGPAPAKKQADPNSCAEGGTFFDDTHVIMTKDSRLKFLADIFDLKDAIYSIGDFFLMFGEWMWSWAPIAWLALIVRKFIEG